MEGYEKTLTLASKLNIGGTTSLEEGTMKETALRLKLGPSGKITNSGGSILFKSTSGKTEKIYAAGVNLPETKWEGAGGIWKLEEAIEAAQLAHTRGELKTNGMTCTTGGAFESSGALVRVLTLGTSVIKCLSASFEGENLTFSGASATFELTNPTLKNAQVFNGASRSFGTATFVGTYRIAGSNTFVTINNNTTHEPFKPTGNLTAGSAVIKNTVTNEWANNTGMEITGPGIPAGTTILGIANGTEATMSANAETTLTGAELTVYPAGLMATEGTTQTLTGSYNTNGVSEANCARLASNVPGKSFTITKTSGLVNVNFMRVKDSHATGGAEWYAGSGSINVSGNEGWKFESPFRLPTIQMVNRAVQRASLW